MNRFFCLILATMLSTSVWSQSKSGANYTAQWKAINKLLTDGQPRSALTEIEKVYQSALKDKQYGQLIKAVTERMNCQYQVEASPFVAVLQSLQQDAAIIPFPAKAIIYSLTAEVYREYYAQNRWKILGRTTVQGENDDLETLSIAGIQQKISFYDQLSLHETALLQKTPIGDYKNALTENSANRYLRPTLYDLLAHRVIDAHIKNDMVLSPTGKPFPIDHITYLSDAPAFVRTVISHSDTLSPAYQVMKLFQELTRFRLMQDDINALVDVNLKRFEYVKQNGIYDDADALYETALKYQMEISNGQKIWGKAAYTLAYHYKQQGEQWQQSQIKYRYRIVEATDLCREIQKNAILQEDKKYAESLVKDATNNMVSLQMEKNNLPGKPILAQVTYKNLKTVYLNVYGCSSTELEMIGNYGSDQVQKVKQVLAKLPRKTSQEIVLPVQHDYQHHRTEIKIDSLPAGSYLLVVSDKPDPVKDKVSVLSYNPIQTTNLNVMQRALGNNHIEVYVVDALSGKPLQEATVDVFLRKYDQQVSQFTEVADKTFLTDSFGITAIPKSEDNSQKILSISYEEDLLRENMFHSYFRKQEQAKQIVLFTDRAIYRPGQTVYFKGLAYKTDSLGNSEIMTKRKCKVTLQDVNGKDHSRQEFTTNEFGSFNGSFTIPQGLLNGQMQLVTDNGSVYFQVEEYKRPTFEVKMHPIVGNYRLGDSITLTGEAKALAGYPVDGAATQYSVVRRTNFRTYPRWHIFPPIRSEHLQIASGTLQTDNKGMFSVTFKAEAADIKADLIYTYELTIDVTDISGETRSTLQEIRLSKTPVLLKTNIPEQITPDKLEYEVITSNLDGVATAANVQVEVFTLRGPERLLRNRLWSKPDTIAMSLSTFESYFPEDVYGNEDDPTNYPKERLSSWNIVTPATNQIDLSVLKNAPSGWYMIQLKATAGQHTTNDSLYVQYQRNDDAITHMDRWLTVVKASGEPGDTAIFRVAGGNAESYIRYDVLFGDEVISRQWIMAGLVPQELKFPVEEAYRGGFAIQFAMIQNNRKYTSLQKIEVPYSNKKLDIAFSTFRDQLLPGEKEKWTLTVKQKSGKHEASEMVATLYDASLDAFVPHRWTDRFQFYPNREYQSFAWNSQNNWEIFAYPHHLFAPDYNTQPYAMDYDRLHTYEKPVNQMRMKRSIGIASTASIKEDATDLSIETSDNELSGGSGTPPPVNPPLTEIATRSNFNETAFFYPELRTNDKGEILVEFTVPEALTRWNMLGFAHTKDLKAGNITNSLITQKQVAISANLPRFFREGDTLVLSAKVNNLTEGNLEGKALLRLYDAFTMQSVDAKMLKTNGTQAFSSKAGQSAAVQWKLVVPEGLQAVTYRLTAQAGKHTDGEERSVPVLTNRILVTESMPFMVRGEQREDFRFTKLATHQSSTLKNHRLTLEYTSNPAWYAVQAIPYLMEQPNECTEQVFAGFYANSLASAITNSSPRIKQIFNQWKSIPDSKALLSSLEKNQELKQALLEETPWVTQAATETERKKRIGLLFDLNRMGKEQERILEKLKAMQGSNGGFPWFAGQPEDRFVTQHIIVGLEHLRNLNALPRRDDINEIIQKGMEFCHIKIAEDYKAMLEKQGKSKIRQEQINRTQLHYLYMCSFSQHRPLDTYKAFDFYLKQTETHWTELNLYEQAMAAMVMYRFGKADVSQVILRSLKERAQHSDDMGMYWNDNRTGYFWNEAPIETQAMLIEAFDVAGSDTQAVEDMKVWLLCHKQTTDWKTTKATTEAVYALLIREYKLLENSEPLDIRIGGKPLKKVASEPIRPEAGTGYVSTSWSGNDISSSMAHLRITNPNSGTAWGAMYWQYFEQLDKITASENNLKMSKQLYLKQTTASGKELIPIFDGKRLQVGDMVTVRMELRADRDFEYVHLKDLRAAAFEPVNAISGYHHKDGLGYYESIKDASVNFFISYMRKGTYVFEYDLRVTHAGTFSNGITSFQCMYAPEFNTHSEGIRVEVK